MAGPHSYSRATIFALAGLGSRTCYWPDPPCPTPVTVIIKGHPVRNVEIAHIRAANLNGPRYVSEMTDEQRRHWSNLVLLCTPHHNMIDKIKPSDYPIEVLERWKLSREKDAAGALDSLAGITEDRLQDMISGAVQEATEQLKVAISRIATIDPDAAGLLRNVARNINSDTADTLYSAARALSPIMNLDNVETLFEAAHTLRQLNLAAAVSNLDDLLPRLERTVRDLRNAQNEMY